MKIRKINLATFSTIAALTLAASATVAFSNTARAGSEHYVPPAGWQKLKKPGQHGRAIYHVMNQSHYTCTGIIHEKDGTSRPSDVNYVNLANAICNPYEVYKRIDGTQPLFLIRAPSNEILVTTTADKQRVLKFDLKVFGVDYVTENEGTVVAPHRKTRAIGYTGEGTCQ